mmetsp:Transcript_55071/g.160725  ORF Transcript_55071/g.160725 Transcript_55071/m.160725 type:complete len:255 (+) Transcript_55071:14-778(+)
MGPGCTIHACTCPAMLVAHWPEEEAGPDPEPLLATPSSAEVSFPRPLENPEATLSLTWCVLSISCALAKTFPTPCETLSVILCFSSKVLAAVKAFEPASAIFSVTLCSSFSCLAFSAPAMATPPALRAASPNLSFRVATYAAPAAPPTRLIEVPTTPPKTMKPPAAPSAAQAASVFTPPAALAAEEAALVACMPSSTARICCSTGMLEGLPFRLRRWARRSLISCLCWTSLGWSPAWVGSAASMAAASSRSHCS